MSEHAPIVEIIKGKNTNLVTFSASPKGDSPILLDSYGGSKRSRVLPLTPTLEGISLI